MKSFKKGNFLFHMKHLIHSINHVKTKIPVLKPTLSIVKRPSDNDLFFNVDFEDKKNRKHVT